MTRKVKSAYLDPYAHPDHIVNKPKVSNPLIEVRLIFLDTGEILNIGEQPRIRNYKMLQSFYPPLIPFIFTSLKYQPSHPP